MTHCYKVHRAHKGDAQVPVQLMGGAVAEAVVPSFIVELVPDAHHSGTLTFIYSTPEEIAAAEATYIVGETVIVTVVKGESNG